MHVGSVHLVEGIQAPGLGDGHLEPRESEFCRLG